MLKPSLDCSSIPEDQEITMPGVKGCWRPAKAFVCMSHNLLKCQDRGRKDFFFFPHAQMKLQQVLSPALGLVNGQTYSLLPLQKIKIRMNFLLTNKPGITFSSAFAFVGSCLWRLTLGLDQTRKKKSRILKTLASIWSFKTSLLIFTSCSLLSNQDRRTMQVQISVTYVLKTSKKQDTE